MNTAMPGVPVNKGVGPVRPTRGVLRPLGLDEVKITGGFWGGRQAVNGSATLGHALSWMERLGWVGNFTAAVEGRLPGARSGREFSDSDVYKLAEAMAWEVARSGDAAVASALSTLADRISAAQEADGYLNTAFGRSGQRPRYSDLEWGHELYCYGHLIQAGVADARANTDTGLFDVARRAADHVCQEFGPGGNEGYCGHPGIEMALVELARVTGEQRYLDQAALFVGRRGHGRLADIEFGPAYFQDDVPVREASVLRGHAVRALYLAAGAVDVAVETGDDALLEALVEQWETTVGRRTYITGGVGSHHSGESFGADYVLPPDRAYSETCAAIASVMLSWRLLLATGDVRYADLAERTLFNVVATSPSPDGRAFFYANTLHQRQRGSPPGSDGFSPFPAVNTRAAWFAVSCCPPNIARTFASLSAYVATAGTDRVQIHQFADADIGVALDGGQQVGLRMRTSYPDDGTVTVEVTRAPAEPVTISLRVPPWSRDVARVTGPGDVDARSVRTPTADVTRIFERGDVVRLELATTARWITPDPRIDALRGTAAVERGPLVYCAESADLPDGTDVDAVRADTGSPPVERDGEVVISGSVVQLPHPAWPYAPNDGTAAGSRRRTVEIPLVPYHSWGQRGPSTMRVWLPEDDS